MFDDGKNTWTREELALIDSWKREARDRNETQVGRCSNCRYWWCDQAAAPYCDTCLTRGLAEGLRLAREAQETVPSMKLPRII